MFRFLHGRGGVPLDPEDKEKEKKPDSDTEEKKENPGEVKTKT